MTLGIEVLAGLFFAATRFILTVRSEMRDARGQAGGSRRSCRDRARRAPRTQQCHAVAQLGASSTSEAEIQEGAHGWLLF